MMAVRRNSLDRCRTGSMQCNERPRRAADERRERLAATGEYVLDGLYQSFSASSAFV
jgi:hypothetical protein